MKLTLLYRRRWWLFYLPVLLCAGLALWWSATVWKPLPPRHVVLAAGAQQGSYARLAQRYAEQLEREGITVDIAYSADAQGALARLQQPALPSAPSMPSEGRASPATVAFAQGLQALPGGADVQALAVVGQEPVWVFSGPSGATQLAQARGQRIAAGHVDSATRRAANALLTQVGLQPGDVRLEDLAGIAAANALVDGKVDIVIVAASEDDESVQLMTRSSTVQLLGTDGAAAVAARHPAMQPLLLPQGAIELRGDIPPRDLTLMSLQTHLLVAAGMHPALQRAVLDAAQLIHEQPRFLQRHGQFPSFSHADFPLSPTARDYGLGSRPWLESLLPYGKAQFVELLLYAVLPIALAAFGLLAWIPRLFDWRINSALHNFYGELKFLETEIDHAAIDNPLGLRRLLERLDQIEQQVIVMELPEAYSERWYTLREHLAAARERLLKLRAR